ncbi:glutamate racemase [Vibrio sp. CAU 1672]|uniref:glutamate racemase n=1 Tax=Vibrio sp. CAU 1672 TaxID=3032594 RepID=UPI0023DBA281|nr:glutamate racemase [Vibrio sp. CAU 1672]MDF2155971.1 glutamate racemase [Vibrio sp. CAU 1672]
MRTASNKKVLVFDSGVGGLSVFKEIHRLLPQLDYLYLFDNQAYPYGELDQEVLISRVNQLVSALVEEYQADIVVIACNTASTIVLPSLRENLSIPVVGVVPAIKPASLLASRGVGLIATPATVTREYTHELIRDFAQGKPVELLGSTRLVDMAEEKLRGVVPSIIEIERILLPLRDKVDVAVLGCTHFPLLRQEIQIALGGSVALVDSGEAIARRVKVLLKDVTTEGTRKEGSKRIFASASPWQEDALNCCLDKMGFNPVQVYRLPDV